MLLTANCLLLADSELLTAYGLLLTPVDFYSILPHLNATLNASSFVLLLSGFRIAAQYKRAVVFRLGRYRATKGPGLYWIIPLIEWQTMLDLRTVTDAIMRHDGQGLESRARFTVLLGPRRMQLLLAFLGSL